ncbi:MAG: Gfo/Idh/MocA family oxidoreductase [Magnetococcus sp. YQC-9]
MIDSLPRKLEVAFLGGAYHSAAGRAHRSALELDQRYEIVAGCFSRHPEENAFSAAQYRVAPERTHANLETLLDAEIGRIDAVVILTPTDQHFEQLKTCMDRKIPIICEKAMVVSRQQALTIHEQVQTHSAFLVVTYNYTGYPMLRELKQLIGQNQLGRIRQILIEMPQEGFIRVNADGTPIVPQEWRLHDREIPTISLDLGVHLHSLVQFLTGARPIEVVSTANSHGNFPTIIDNISCIANYTREILCSIWYSKTAQGYRNGLRIRIFGELGSAEWVQENPEYMILSDNQGIRRIVDRSSCGILTGNDPRYARFKAGHPAGFIEAFANYYNDIADALLQYRSGAKNYLNDHVFGADTAFNGIRMLDAIARSAREHGWVSVEDA